MNRRNPERRPGGLEPTGSSESARRGGTKPAATSLRARAQSAGAPAAPARAAGRRWAAGLLLLALLALLPAPAAADGFLTAYKDALEALEAGEARRALTLLDQAIAERPEERARLPARFYFKPYVPHYYRGRAHFLLGDCPAALQAWAEAQRQGVVTELDENAQLLADKAQCEALLEQAGSALNRAEAAVERAARSAVDLSELSEAPELAERWSSGAPPPAARQRQAEARLAEARRLLVQARQTAPSAADGSSPQAQAAGRAAAAATEAQQLLDELTALAREVRGEVASRRQEGRSAVEEVLDEGRQLLRATRYLSPYPPQIARSRSELEGLIAAGEATDATVSAERLEALRQRLVVAVRDLRNAAAPPPASLRQAVEELLAGQPEEVLATLEELEPRNDRIAAHVYLLRSAARFALWVADGETDPALLAQARADADASRRADPTLTPPKRAFSPRFLTFFAASARDAKASSSPATTEQP